MENIPKKIYLQVGIDPKNVADFNKLTYDIFWSATREDESDIEYVLPRAHLSHGEIEKAAIKEYSSDGFGKYSHFVEGLVSDQRKAFIKGCQYILSLPLHQIDWDEVADKFFKEENSGSTSVYNLLFDWLKSNFPAAPKENEMIEFQVWLHENNYKFHSNSKKYFHDTTYEFKTHEEILTLFQQRIK